MIEASTAVSHDTSGSEARASLRHLAWPLGVLGLLIPAATATLVFLNHSAIHSIDQASPIGVILPIGFSIIGTLLASRRSRNTMGWIFLGIGLFVGVNGLASEYVFRSLYFHRLPFVTWAAWLQNWVVWLVYPSGLALFLFLLFPDGRFQSRRWRRLAWVVTTCMTAGVVLSMVQPTITVTGSAAIRNPLAVKALASVSNYNSFVWFPLYVGGLGLLVAAMVGTILRTRRSTGELRQQLRWLGYAAGVTAAFLVASIFVGIFVPNLPQGWMDLVIVLGFGVAVPVSCGIAILKHGLYELDIVVSKTVVYGVLAAFFTAVYVAVVVGIGTVIGSRRNPFLTLVAAALIALAFNPVRDRAKRFANRIVYGKRATPYEVLSEFSERVAGTYSLEDVLPRMARILGEGTGARQARVWLKIGHELRPAASWGDPGGDDRPLPAPDGQLPAIAGASKVVPVRHQDDLLGVLTVTKPPNEPLTVPEGKLVDDLAAQAGLVLRNVRLTEELRANLEELRASRQRIVTAQDVAARRLERNIHDGAQQQLVAMAVKQRLAESLVHRDPDKAVQLLSQLRDETTEALENLRDLARGIYPPLLGDQGLAAALRAQVRKAPFPVVVQAEGIGRYRQDIEAAVYFSVLESLQNVAKYANASNASVGLAERKGSLTFAVRDDGVGFDPAARGYGTGMQGMSDRLAALGGVLRVTSAPGEGTLIEGLVPIDATPPDQTEQAEAFAIEPVEAGLSPA
jgi:signal transduction histidine kinase